MCLLGEFEVVDNQVIVHNAVIAFIFDKVIICMRANPTSGEALEFDCSKRGIPLNSRIFP